MTFDYRSDPTKSRVENPSVAAVTRPAEIGGRVRGDAGAPIIHTSKYPFRRNRKNESRTSAAPAMSQLGFSAGLPRRFPSHGASPREDEDRAAGDEAPEGAADSVEADARRRDENVASAASRSEGSESALCSAEPKALSSASPATASTRIGEPAAKCVTPPANRPKTI